MSNVIECNTVELFFIITNMVYSASVFKIGPASLKVQTPVLNRLRSQIMFFFSLENKVYQLLDLSSNY